MNQCERIGEERNEIGEEESHYSLNNIVIASKQETLSQLTK